VLYKVRPGNYPVRRIIALAYLLLRFRRYGWLESWLRALRGAVKIDSRVDLGALLMVKTEGYWSGHYDFNLPAKAPGSFLLGRDRAAETIINVVLPFFIAWSSRQGENALTGGLRNIFRRLPPGESHALQRHMLSQLKAKEGIVNSALRQQGLLHLFKAYCRQGRCIECYLNR
jgi:hypothetical protein